jgi:hypothetical protein
MKIMRSHISLILLFLIVAVIFNSCEKEIDLKLPKQESKLVVEGYIEQGQPAYVFLTKSASYFDPVDSTSLFSSIVMDASVKISDENNSEQLILGIVNAFPPIAYVGNTIKGEIGKSYTLTVDWNGQTYTATTTIKNTVKWDSLWFKLKDNSDSIGNIFASATENGSTQDYYRAYTKILHVDDDFVPIFGSVWDDKFFNGESFVAQLYHGFASNIIPPDQDNSRGLGYKLGDTVVTKLCTMDFKSFTFWKAAESEIYSGGNPFASTTSVPSNISNGALGCFTGYGATYDTIVCKIN